MNTKVLSSLPAGLPQNTAAITRLIQSHRRGPATLASSVALHWEKTLVAYRFLLEVPESLVENAKLVVGSANDAEVVLVRNSHGQGFDDPYADLTVAAHSLRVVDSVYDWYSSTQPSPSLHLVLHSGQRLNLADFDRRAMTTAIRRDQPWVERTIPRIGEHSRDVLPGAPDQSDYKAAQIVPKVGARGAGEPIVTATKRLRFLSPAHRAIQVTELDRAERYYIDFLGLHLLGREREDDNGNLNPVERDYHAARALAQGTEADLSYLANGPVEIRLERVGRGARLARDGGQPIAIAVDRTTFLQLKGDALMRGMEIVLDQPESFAVRDIYGLVWQFQESADVPALA